MFLAVGMLTPAATAPAGQASLQVPAGANTTFYSDQENFALFKPVEAASQPRQRRLSRVGSFRERLRSKERREATKKEEHKLPNGSAVQQLANGPVSKVPPSQRRVPPAKLNLTLDLSVTQVRPCESLEEVARPEPEAADTSSLAGSCAGVAASSGVVGHPRGR